MNNGLREGSGFISTLWIARFLRDLRCVVLAVSAAVRAASRRAQLVQCVSGKVYELVDVGCSCDV